MSDIPTYTGCVGSWVGFFPNFLSKFLILLSSTLKIIMANILSSSYCISGTVLSTYIGIIIVFHLLHMRIHRLHVRELKYREAQYLTQDHTSAEWGAEPATEATYP